MASRSPPGKPKLELKVLDPPQRRLWRELGATPGQFTLYGGTALALRLGHRKSVDFDFFTAQHFDPTMLRQSVAYLADSQVAQSAAGTLTCIVERGGPVRVSFFCPPQPLAILGAPYESKSPRLRLAPLIDIAATKLNVLTHRASPRDYVDIHALLTRAGIDLATMLAAVPFVFGDRNFNPTPIMKALSYHGDAAVAKLPARVRRDLERAVRSFDFAAFPALLDQFRHNPDLWRSLS